MPSSDEAFRALIQLQLTICLVSQLMLLTMQAIALRKHGHRCMLWLVLSTAFAIAATCMSSIPLFLNPSMEWLVLLQIVLTLLTIITLSLGLFGTFHLFRAYARLSEEAGHPHR